MKQTAAIFPGQGSQSVGMLESLASDREIVRETFAEASSAIERDLWALVSEGPADELNQTRWTQPAMLAGDIAVWRVYREAGGALPAAMAGHSLGEYAALVAAGSIDFTDAVAVVHERGRLMQAAVAEGEGAMAAILGLDDDRVAEICESVADGDVVAPANYNAPGQLVIAGQRAAVERAAEACKLDGAKRAMLLPVSVPAHSALMTPAVDGLAMALENIDIAAPAIPVLHNLDMSTRDESDAIRGALVEQLTHPVPWTGTIRAMTDRGIGRFLECGPGRVLTGLGRRIERGAEWMALEAPDGVEQALAS
ncbi:MAG: ACP S-malonyltransferase [Candidatus Wenzhouxiangella sp. M2_3B_020]